MMSSLCCGPGDILQTLLTVRVEYMRHIVAISGKEVRPRYPDWVPRNTKFDDLTASATQNTCTFHYSYIPPHETQPVFWHRMTALTSSDACRCMMPLFSVFQQSFATPSFVSISSSFCHNDTSSPRNNANQQRDKQRLKPLFVSR